MLLRDEHVCLLNRTCRWFPRPEPEGWPPHRNLRVDEAGIPEPVRKGLRIDWRHRVKQMKKPKAPTGDAIGAGEDSTWAEQASYLREEPILQFRRGHVVEHRKADGCVKGCVLQRRRCRVLT